MTESEGGIHAMRKLLTMALLGEQYINAFEDWEAEAEESGADGIDTLGWSGMLPSLDLMTGIDPDDVEDFVEEGLVEAVAKDDTTLRLTPEGIGMATSLFEFFSRAIEDEFDFPMLDSFLGPTHAFRFSLELEDCACRREIIVPACFLFQEFHETIQIVFGWMDYHLWDFTLRVGNHQITVSDVDTNDLFDGDMVEQTLERTVAGTPPSEGMQFRAYNALSYRLDEVFPRTKLATYRYDYGDDWEITIRLEEDIDEYEGDLPICVGGVGDAPPEDVGGAPGFRDFNRVMRGPQSERKQELTEWAKDQGFEAFNVDNVNRQLHEWLITDPSFDAENDA